MQTIRIDLTTTGILNITDTNDISLKVITLQSIVEMGQLSGTFVSDCTPRDNYSIVSISYTDDDDDVKEYGIDIQDVESTPYATTQDLIDAINTAIAAL